MRITDIATGTTNEEKVLRDVYDHARDYVLAGFPWPFATEYVTLGLIEGTSADPVNGDWTFSYAYPAGCLKVRRLVGPERRQPTIPLAFAIGRNDEARVIFSDTEDAVAEITVRVSDEAQFDEMFVDALSWKLAELIAPSLSKIAGIVKTAQESYANALGLSRESSVNESQQSKPIDAEWILDR